MPRSKVDPNRPNPVTTSLDLLTKLRGVTKEVLVGFSGGKDSWCVIDLAVKIFGESNVHPYFMYFLPGLQCEQEALHKVERRFPNMPAVLRLPHFETIRAIRSGTYCQPRAIKRVTPQDIERIVRGRSGVNWILLGHRLTDSLHRRGLITRCGGIETKFRRAYPIAEWNPNDVFSYLSAQGIPTPPSFGAGRQQTSNVGLTFECLFFLRENYPEDYQAILKVFPNAKTILQREEVRARHQIYYDESEAKD